MYTHCFVSFIYLFYVREGCINYICIILRFILNFTFCTSVFPSPIVPYTYIYIVRACSYTYISYMYVYFANLTFFYLAQVYIVLSSMKIM